MMEPLAEGEPSSDVRLISDSRVHGTGMLCFALPLPAPL
jgi:hypothetical protein